MRNTECGTQTPRVVVAGWGELPPTAQAAHDEVRVWVIPLDSPPAGDEELAACLTDDERQRAGRYKVAKARHEFVTGRGLLRQLLGRSLGLAPRDVPIAYTGAGKPVLATGGLHFNVTHTADLALIALAARPVGIDVERVRDMADPDGLVERFFSPAEQAAFRGLPEGLRRGGFFRGWTCKEAVLKAAAMSVTCLSEFDVELHPERPAAVLATRHPVLDEMSWGLTAWEPAAGFAAAVAVSVRA